ncbi:MAG: DNA primase [Bacteroidaceae bacterium]
MNKIPQDIIDRVIETADIVDVVGDDVALRKQGVNYIGLCPFHNEKTPSFVVSPYKNVCKCFSCGKGGNVIWYMMEKNGMTFPEALHALGNRYHVDVPTVTLTAEQQQVHDEKASTMIAITAAYNLFHKNLDTTPVAKAYLAERKISLEIAECYGLGFAYDYDGLSREMAALGYEQRWMVAAGISYYDETKKKFRDTFWQRILFPFYNKMGQVVGFTGRAIADTQTPKYKNTGDTILFSKGGNIYGLYQARTAIQAADKVYIVEGQFDVLSMAQAGVHNVVGGSGTAFTEAQRKMLHGITSNVVFIYDGDAAGVKAVLKNLAPFICDEFKVRCIRLPQGKDPDDMAKTKGEELAVWLKKAETGYVEFLYKALFAADDDEYKKFDHAKQIVAIITKEREPIIRGQFLELLAKKTGYELEQLIEVADNMPLVKAPERFEPGFLGSEYAKDFIDLEDKCIHLVNNFERFGRLLGEKEPFVLYTGIPSPGDIQNLSQITDRVVVHSPEMNCTARNENSDCVMMKELFKFGLTVDVLKNGELQGFIYFYVQYYGEQIRDEAPTPEVKNEYITRCAEMISFAKQSIQTVNMQRWSELLGLKVSAMRELIKPFAAERKSKQRMERERGDVYNELQFVDTDRVPDYVEENEEYSKMLRRYNFYPLVNKECIPVSYMFKTDANSYHRVADFYIEPLFHVYSQNKEENKRVIKINRLYVNKPTYVEWPSSVFAKLTTFQEMLINEGAFNFENGDAKDYAKIWNCISYDFPKCNKIKVYGQQEEDCFLFANGIFHRVDNDWRFEYADELGLMPHDDTIFYSPAFSKVNVHVRKDNDEYEQDRWLVYTDTPEKKRITFEHWASLMNEVYKINDNGKWALIYAIMCAFRSEIHPINRTFTAIFFIGPTQSGKTQIAVSIRSLFIKPEAPCYNLNSGTDAAFFSVLERFRDVPMVFEEYNDDEISDQKFQGLKSVTYDGDGKQKRKAATGNDIETSKVNAPVVILGQEAPQKDDNSLGNRVVLCEVPKNEEINEDHAQQIFQELKESEKAGLSYLLTDILQLRPVFRNKFAPLMKESSKELQTLVESSGSRSGEQTRVINTVSMFLATVKLISRYAPELKLPFTYEEFRSIAVDKIKKQVDMLTKTDKLAMFFNTIDYLIDKGSVRYGRDFKIERPGRITLKGGIEQNLQPVDTAVLYINLSNIHKMYMAAMPNGNKPLSLTTLEINLNSHPAYIGVVSNTRFRWMEVKDIPDGRMRQNEKGEIEPNMMLIKVMDKKEKQTSAVVLNYDVIKNMMGIDFEREERNENESQPDIQQGKTVEQELPF